MMNTYLVYFRPDSGLEMGATTVHGFRVEGWRSDYAFFGDPGDMSQPTDLYPRDLVMRVQLQVTRGETIQEYRRRLREEIAAGEQPTGRDSNLSADAGGGDVK